MTVNITICKPNQDDLPARENCKLGDLAMLSGGDIFCFLGNQWKMLGGRWIEPRFKQAFFNYVRTGWPDHKTMSYDLNTVFDLSIFDALTDVEDAKKDITQNPLWINKFKEAILVTSKLLEELSLDDSKDL